MECPPGTHSIFDPCPGNCTEDVSARDELYEVLSGHRGEVFATSLINEFVHELAEEIRQYPWNVGCAAGCCDDERGAEKAADLIDPKVKK